jgi:hypothetical protein
MDGEARGGGRRWREVAVGGDGGEREGEERAREGRLLLTGEVVRLGLCFVDWRFENYRRA